jgi:hypothetical protein
MRRLVKVPGALLGAICDVDLYEAVHVAEVTLKLYIAQLGYL